MAISTLKSTRDIARIWFFWKVPALLIFCLIVFSICFYSFTRTPVYVSTAKILLLPKTNDGLVITAGQGQRQYDIQRVDSQDINTEVELIQSGEVLRKTLSHFGYSTKPTEEPVNPLDDGMLQGDSQKKAMALFTALEVEPVFSSNMISVSMKSTNQERVAEVLNKLLDVYIEFHKNMYSVGESEEFYDDQKQYYGKRLKEARKKLRVYNNTNDITNMEGQIDANIGLITQFNGEFQNIEILIAENEARIKMLESGTRIKGNKFVLTKEMRSMPVIIELARGLVPLLIKRTEISKTFTKQSREFKQIDDQIAMLRQEILNETMNASRTDQLETTTLKTKRDELGRRIQILKDQVKAFHQKQQEKNALELDLEIAKKNYLLYGSKTEDSRLYAMKNKTNLSNVIIAEPAVMPEKADSPNKMLAFQVSVFLGLFAAFILPFILETLDQKIKTADDIENVLSVPVVCSYREL